MQELKDRVAIITGGGGGIGGAIALRFAHEGAKIVIAEINSEAAQRKAGEISADSGEAISVVTDVTNKSSVEQMVQETKNRWGRIDILVNVAGGSQVKEVIDLYDYEWDHVINLNLKSVFLCSQAVLSTMIKQKYGKIVSLSSIWGFTGNATRASYAAAKAGVTTFTKSLALEVIRDGINVNAIAPGSVATNRLRVRYTDAEWAEKATAIPMGRAAESDEIAPTALFLVKDENQYITGQTLHINGGWLNY
jgi:NAD(P)-dependent dehydrogenase (short-subunit alcohol dehydrogenase family)